MDSSRHEAGVLKIQPHYKASPLNPVTWMTESETHEIGDTEHAKRHPISDSTALVSVTMQVQLNHLF